MTMHPRRPTTPPARVRLHALRPWDSQGHHPGHSHRGLMLGTAAVVLTADQVTKAVALAVGPGASVAGGLLRVELVHNPGAAFGLGPALTPLYAVLAFLAVAVCLYYGLRSRSVVVSACLGLIAGGAAGNLADRLVRPPGPLRGAVVDWIKLAFYPPVFNLADVALRLGVAILVIRMLYQASRGGARVSADSKRASAAQQRATGDRDSGDDRPCGHR